MQLRITAGPKKGVVFPLHKRPIVIGRDRGATIRLDDPKVSRNHAIIEPEAAGTWVLRDLGSTNETCVNGESVTHVVLKEGDTVGIGSTEMCLSGTQAEPKQVSCAEGDTSEVSVEMNPASLQARVRSSTEAPGGISLQAALFEIGGHSHLNRDPREFLADACQVVASCLKAETWAWVEWPDGLKKPFVARGERQGQSLESRELVLSHTLIQRVVAEDTGLVSTDISGETEQHQGITALQIGSAIAVPLRTGDGPQAALYLDRTETEAAFTRDELEVLAVLGMRVAMHLENLKLFGELQEAYEQLRCSRNELLRSEKLAGVGRLASSFAHDLNNPLGSILGFLELAQKTIPAPPLEGPLAKIENYVEKATAAANYCRALSGNLLAFARQKPATGDETQSTFNILETVQATAGFCQSTLNRSGVTVFIDIDEELTFSGDRSTLQQLIVNLISNAADALGDMEENSDRQIHISGHGTDGGVHLEFADNGPGIPEDVAPRIFEPLFTTKGNDRGTGLGLFVVHRIVEHAGGDISFCGRPEGGTVFVVDLPCTLPQFGRVDDDITLADGSMTAEKRS